MKKYLLILLSFLLCTAVLAGCSCRHDWAEATCLNPKTCTKCGAAESEALGHDWQNADCMTPKTCIRCGLTEGSPLGHSWEEATCAAPKTCTVCAATTGQSLEHTWEGEATLFTAPLCAACGAEGEPLPGYFEEKGLAPNVQAGQAADYVTNTYVRPDLNTTGIFLTSDVRVFESDDTHRVKKGYEWRSVDISIIFSDKRFNLYGATASYARADYYQDQELKPPKKQERFTVTYRDKEYKCLANYEEEMIYSDDGSIFLLTCSVQVPVGYDGVVLAFCRSGMDIRGMHLHEAADENTLLVRMA